MICWHFPIVLWSGDISNADIAIISRNLCHRNSVRSLLKDFHALHHHAALEEKDASNKIYWTKEKACTRAHAMRHGATKTAKRGRDGSSNLIY
jgi:hypothetical protein